MTSDKLSLMQPKVSERRRRSRYTDSPYKVVSVRMRAAEFESFSQQSRALGLTSNMALRVAARRIAGFIELDETTRANLRKTTDNIGRIANMLNQMDRLARASGRFHMKRLETVRNGFGKEFVALDSQLRVLLNVSRRRGDGKKMLDEATK